ncbi:MAG: dihydroorotate dehydrogenase electron transfer subunit [Pseudomonadota bacterium]|nr:dihydroorotate dehydrogenase electron transfer subunit [Pseudomonadota bacterium]
MKNTQQEHRNKIFIEDSRIESITTFPNSQFLMRLHSPKCATASLPGSFIHIQCDQDILMRRPLSIMRVNAKEGWVEILFKIVGNGLNALSKKKVGELVSSIGPIGNGFIPSKKRPETLLIGGGVGIPPIIFLAETLKGKDRWSPCVIMGSEIPFPFDIIKRKQKISWLEEEANGTMPLLEEWKIPGVLCSLNNISGSYRGYVTDAADQYLHSISQDQLDRIEIFSCGPTIMLEAVARLAKKYRLPCQVSLEEFMACAVGGCAGCAVPIKTEDGISMQRVCVDGPVFEAAHVF